MGRSAVIFKFRVGPLVKEEKEEEKEEEMSMHAYGEESIRYDMCACRCDKRAMQLGGGTVKNKIKSK